MMACGAFTEKPTDTHNKNISEVNDMNKPILLNTHDTDKILSGLITITLMKGQNQPTIEESAKCYLCNEDSVVGECQITGVEEYKSYPGRVIGQAIGMKSDEYHKFAAGATVHGWTIADAKRYDEPMPLASWGINKAPKDWKYIDGGEVEAPEEKPAESQQDAQESELVAEADVDTETEAQNEEPPQEEYYGRGRRLRR